jgi:glycosyltransferase involved in cell wall biosynthesis
MNNKNPLVSVVIPTRNRPELIQRALNGVLNQTLRDIEVIVVIDGPDKETECVMSKLKRCKIENCNLTPEHGITECKKCGSK